MPATQTQSNAPAENFAALFEESLARQEMRQGELITAEVTRVDYNVVVVNAGLKSESFIPIEEFKNDNGVVEVEARRLRHRRDRVDRGRLRHDAPVARQGQAPQGLARPRASMEQGSIVQGMVTSKVKGGLTVMMNGIRAFLPGSLVDIRPVKDTSPYEGKQLDFKVIKLDRKRNNVVVSRRAVLEESLGEEREKLLSTLQEGAIVKGIVKNITDYGAFVDLGRHRRPAAHHRPRLASRQASVGSAVGRRRGHRQGAQVRPGEEPRFARPEAARRGSVGRPVAALSAGHAPVRQGHQHHRLRRVRRDRVGHRGPRARLGDGLDQQEHPSDQGRAARRRGRGDDPRDRRGPPPHLARHEAVHAEPVGRVLDEPQEGRQGEGQIKSITDFGVFVGLPGGIDGLVHLSDLSWNAPGETAVRDYKKGQEVEAVVLAIDVERERISLGIKQLEGDPFTNFVATHDKGSVVTGTVKSLDRKGAVVSLGGDIEGYLRASESRATASRTSARA
jgi:small subunit ribosomal protein S1